MLSAVVRSFWGVWGDEWVVSGDMGDGDEVLDVHDVADMNLRYCWNGDRQSGEYRGIGDGR